MQETENTPKLLERAFSQYVEYLAAQSHTDPEFVKTHLADTPERLVKMYGTIFDGLSQNPAEPLRKSFLDRSDEMVSLYNIPFVSWCAHHFLPFHGQIHFGYIPNGRIVGLSKIPRFLEILCARPQVQEQLTSQAVSVFDEALNTKGCICVVDAVHCCMFARGVRKGADTRTTSLSGIFRSNPSAKMEFLGKIR